MADAFSVTSLRTAFSFPFQSRDWSGRFLIGTALLFASLFIPIIPALFVYGYVVEVMRQTIKGEAPVLPEWKNWGQLALDGLRSLAVGVAYMGPGLVIMIGGWVVYMAMYFGGGILLAGTPSHQDPSSLVFVLMLGAVVILLLSMFVGWLLSFVGVIPLPVALAHFVANDKLSAAFQMRQWGAIVRADKWGYFIGWVIVLGLVGVMYFALLLMYFTVIFCCVMYFVLIPIGFYLLLISAVIFGQFYREGTARLSLQLSKPEGAQA